MEAGRAVVRNCLVTLDPRTILLVVPFVSVLVFIVDTLPVAAGQALIFVGIAFAVQTPAQKIKSYMRLLPALIGIIIILQMLFGPDTSTGRYILKPLIPEPVPLVGGGGSLKWDGLVLGLTIGCRLVSLALLVPLLAAVEPTRLSLGLVRLGLPYRWASIITIALTVLPAFEADGRAIMDARKLRGVRAFEKGGVMRNMKEYPAIALPLIVNAMRRARIMGIVMDARGFGAFPSRTWRTRIQMGRIDYAAFAISILYGAAVLAANCWVKRGMR